MSDMESTYEEVVDRILEQYRMVMVEQQDGSTTDLVHRAFALLGRMIEPLSRPNPGLDEVQVVRENAIAVAAIGLFLGTMGTVAEDELYRGPPP